MMVANGVSEEIGGLAFVRQADELLGTAEIRF